MHRGVVVTALAAAVLLSGCSSQAVEQGSTAGSAEAVEGSAPAINEFAEEMDSTQEIPLYALTLNVPSSWDVTSRDDNTVQMYPSVGGLAQLSMNGNIDFADDGSAEVDYLIGNLDGDVTKVVSEKRRGSCGNAVTYTVDTERTQDGDLYKGFAEFIVNGHSLYMFLVCVPEADFDNGYGAVLQQIMDGATIWQSTAPLGAGEGGTDIESSPSTDSAAPEQGAQESQADQGSAGTSLAEGTYRVGSDIAAGEYKLTAIAGDTGYWEVTNSSSPDADIVGNDVFNGSTYVTVSDGQYLKLSGCTGQAM